MFFRFKRKWAWAWQNQQKDLSAHWRLFAVRFMGTCRHKPSSSGQRRLIRLGGRPGWSESLLGAQIILIVLLCTGSNEKNGKAINNTINATGMNLTVTNPVAKLKCIYIIVLINTGLKEAFRTKIIVIWLPAKAFSDLLKLAFSGFHKFWCLPNLAFWGQGQVNPFSSGNSFTHILHF